MAIQFQLKVGDKIFRNLSTKNYASSVDSMVAAVQKLPQLKVIPRSDSKIIEPEQTVICLEHEQAYVRRSLHQTEIAYLGTKNLYGCIAVLFYSNMDFFLTHCNLHDTFEFETTVNQFKDKSNVRVILIGGYSPSLDATARETLKNIMVKIYRTANELNLNIECTHQQLMQANIFNRENMPEYVYDKIFSRLNILKQYYLKKFNIVLPIEQLNDRKITEFKERHINKTELDKTLQAFGLLTLISNPEKVENQTKIAEVLKNYLDVNYLLQCLHCLFSVEVFTVLSEMFHPGALNSPNLCNFVFDLKNPTTVLRIDPRFSTFMENNRSLLAADANLHRNLSYHLIYSPESKYVFPELTADFLKLCEEYRSITARPMNEAERRSFAERFQMPYDFICIERVTRWIKNLECFSDTLSQLPDKTLLKIAAYLSLQRKDLFSFALTNKRLCNLVISAKLPAANKTVIITDLLKLSEINASLHDAIMKNDFNLALRKSCVSEEYTDILIILLKNADLLGVDINSRGTKSGTCMEVARAFKNFTAIEIISQYLNKGEESFKITKSGH